MLLLSTVEILTNLKCIEIVNISKMFKKYHTIIIKHLLG